MAVVKWVDLSSVGVHLGSYKDANGGAGLAIIDADKRHHEAITGLGFAPASGALQEGLYLKADFGIRPAELRAAFGELAVRFFTGDRNEINRGFNAKVKEITKINSAALFLQQRPVGLNHLGELVQESVAGRFIMRTVDGKTVVAKESGGLDRALFIRAQNLAELRKVAKGFVKRIVVRSEQLRREHVKRLMDVSNEGGFTERQYQEAIEAGLNELFAEGLNDVIGREAAEPLAAFDLANKLYVGMPELKVRTANSVAHQQYSSPVPIAAIAQALLGPRDAIVGASVLEPTVGNANLVSALNVGLNPDEACRVYGVEIDPARVELAQDVVTQIVLGDASTIDFRTQFGQPEGFDFVIANPPFGSLPAKVDLPLPEGSSQAQMTTQRLDHLILLRSLHARRDGGRAVFITGADSAIENGEIKGRSKYLLNYLHDHYVVEGVVDVSGELYKKQGAQFPLRMYVIGARKTMPEQSVVPEKLDVIRTYEGLRNWAEGVIDRQRTHDVELDETLDAQPAQAASVDVATALQALGADPGAILAVVSSERVIPDVDASWIVMNAPRPLLGHVMVEGDFRHGRFYAAIDPSDETVAKMYLDRNLRDGAYVVFVPLSGDVQSLALKLVPARYRDAYEQLPPADRRLAIATYIGRLDEMTVGALRALESKGGHAAAEDAMLDQQLLRAMIAHGWENQGGPGRLYWVTRTIGGGSVTMVNPLGDRRLSAKLHGDRMLAKHGDVALVDLPYNSAMSPTQNAAMLNAAVISLDPVVEQPLQREAAVKEGEQVRFVTQNNEVVEGLLVEALSLGNGDYRYSIKTNMPDAQRVGYAVRQVWRRFGHIESLTEYTGVAAEAQTSSEQAKYRPFIAEQLGVPTASQLQLDDTTRVKAIAGRPGWTDSLMIDLETRPAMVNVTLDLASRVKSLRVVSAANVDLAVARAESGAAEMIATAFYSDVIERKGVVVGSSADSKREPATFEAVDGVVLLSDSGSQAVMVSRLYVSYFLKEYPTAKFRAGLEDKVESIAVVVDDVTVGVIMTMPSPRNVLEHTLAVRARVDVTAEATAAGVTVRDARLAEKALAQKAQPMLGLDGEVTGWRKLEHDNGDGVTLISSDGLQAVDFRSTDVRSGTEALRAYALAQSFAIDNPYRPQLLEGPAGELVIEPIGRATPERKPQPSAGDAREFTAAPVDNYRVVKTSVNGVNLRPLPGQSFSSKDVESLIRWLGDNGWSAEQVKNHVRGVGPTNSRWTDVPTAAQRRKTSTEVWERAMQEGRDAREAGKSIDEADLTRLGCAAWIDKTFGPQVMSNASKAALSRYLAGESASFEGFAGPTWGPGFASLGVDEKALRESGIGGALSVVKDAYQKALAQPKVDERQDNEFQQRYIAYSNVSEPDTMIPANLSGPVYEALTAIKEAYGDVDEFVSRELQMPPGDLGKYFKAEQVDALAMIFHANNRGLGFLLADKMGVGKGRVLAGVARRERLNGRVPVFITVTPNLFSDFLERDIEVIGSRELFKNPLIINDGSKTVDQDGQVVARSLRRPEYKRFAEKKELPEGTDIVLLTYSQICRQAHKSLTTNYLVDLASRYPLSLLLDESHNGAGASNTSANLEAMIDAIGQRGSVVYSSGTAIKGAKNLRLYKKILPRGIDHEELLRVVESDPLSLQEALNFEIAAQGCLISRELDNAGIEKEYVLSASVDRNRRVADQVAAIFTAMCYLSGDVGKIVGKLNREFRKELEDVPEADREGARMGVASNMNFGSRLHELNRQFLLAIKAPDIVARTIATLEENKKPIISLQHTGESMLVDFVTRANEVYDQVDEKPKLDQRAYILDRPVSFKDLMNKYLEKITWLKIQGRYGDVSYRQVEGEKFTAAIERIGGMIDTLDDDLPITPIDYFREKLAEKGFTVAEISGRNLMSRTLDDGRISIESVPGRSDKTRVNRAVRDFNNGDADVLILTGSGSTGLSVQANPAVGKDVRARRMIKAEMQPDIARERQMDGRHNRTGQVALPEYEIPLCGLPADDRLAMMFNNKNRSLSSSTVANRDSKDLIKQVPDLLNEVGDMAAEDLLRQDPGLAVSLDIELPEDGEARNGKYHHGQWFCNKLSGRLSLLPVAEQERVYALWQAKFVEKLDMLKAEGRNPLEVEVMDFKATVVSRNIFMGEVLDAEGKSSNFNAPIYLTTLEYQKELKAVHADEIDRRVAVMGGGYPVAPDEAIAKVVAYLTTHRESLLEKHRSKKYDTVAAALVAKESNEVQIVAQKLAWLVENLPRFHAGAVFVDSDLDGKKVPRVIVSRTVPVLSDNFALPSFYNLYTMQPGSDVVELSTLSALYSRGISLMATGFDKHAVVRQQFDQAENGVVTKTARVFDGNLFEATALNLRERVGRKIVYTDHTGSRQHGILIYTDVSTRKLEALPEKVRDAHVVLALLEHGVSAVSDPAGDPSDPGFGVVISKLPGGDYKMAVPSARSRGGEVYLDPVLSLIVGKEPENKFNLNFSTEAGKMVGRVQKEHIIAVIQYMMTQKNMNFFYKDRRVVRHVRAQMEGANGHCLDA